MKHMVLSGILGLLAAAGATAPAMALQDAAIPDAKGGAASEGSLLRVPTHDGEQLLRVVNAGALSTHALPDAAVGAAAADGRGCVLHATVIVRANDGDALGLTIGALAGAQIKPEPADPSGATLREFWLVQCEDVARACELAAALRTQPGVLEAYIDIERPLDLRSTLPTDPGFPQQWYLRNTVTPLFDANLEGAWKAGFTGAGITVGVVEFGWNINHIDLAAKYDADASQPAGGAPDHGTSVAGVIGMIADNSIGGAGAAYNSMLSRMYIGSDSATAAALAFRNDLNFVKNNSWGPSDNGRVTTMPSITAQAIADGAAMGRGGLGTVYVWAAGNGGQGNDRVDYDPYASNRYAIAVGAIDSQDRHSLYSEPGSSLMLVTQSDYDLGTSGDQGIYTTSGSSTFTSNFGGSSSAAPLASGVVAVLLETRPDLTWRDVQHVLIRSARKCRPTDPSWRTNGYGRAVSELFGFGAIDAGAAVALGDSWPGIGPEVMYESPLVSVNTTIPDNNPAGVQSSLSVPQNLRIERVQLVLSAPHASLGQLRVAITSPSGTESLLASTRIDTTSGYNAYVFTSVRHWDERSAGTWTVKVSDGAAGTTGTLQSWQLRVFGTEIACPCDWDYADGRTVSDIFLFLESWFAGRGDFNADGLNEDQDIYDFLTCWFGTSCP